MTSIQKRLVSERSKGLSLLFYWFKKGFQLPKELQKFFLLGIWWAKVIQFETFCGHSSLRKDTYIDSKSQLLSPWEWEKIVSRLFIPKKFNFLSISNFAGRGGGGGDTFVYRNHPISKYLLFWQKNFGHFRSFLLIRGTKNFSQGFKNAQQNSLQWCQHFLFFS